MSDRFVFYNPNPDNQRVGDCAIRALCKATGRDWDTIYASVTSVGYELKDMPSSNHVWGTYLHRKGFRKCVIDEGITLAEFAETHEDGTYVVVLEGHVVCTQYGCYFDTWDSGNEYILYYWRKG